jgi:hypothetical protein
MKMKQVIRINNQSSEAITVLIEPLAEEKRLEAKKELYLLAEFFSEIKTYGEVLEMSYKEGGLVIYESSEVNVDWLPEELVNSIGKNTK